MFKSVSHSSAVFIVVAGFQLAFAMAILLESRFDFTTLTIGVLFLLLCISAYRAAYRGVCVSVERFTLDWLPVLASVLGAVATYLLAPVLTPVISAAAIGVLASYIPSGLVWKFGDLSLLQYPVYCGAFVGMSSVWVLPHVGWVVVAGVVAGVLFHAAKSVLLGVGGRLGSFAFVGVACSALLRWIVEQFA